MEFWDIYDASGNPTGEVVPKQHQWREGERHLAAELWLADGQGRLLLQQRSCQCEYYPGVWSLTAGRALAGEDSSAACLREAKEELGLDLRREELRYLRRIIRIDYIWDIYLVRRPSWPGEMRLQPEEVDRVAWLSPADLRRRMAENTVFVYPEMAEVLRQVEEHLSPL